MFLWCWVLSSTPDQLLEATSFITRGFQELENSHQLSYDHCSNSSVQQIRFCQNKVVFKSKNEACHTNMNNEHCLSSILNVFPPFCLHHPLSSPFSWRWITWLTAFTKKAAKHKDFKHSVIHSSKPKQDQLPSYSRDLLFSKISQEIIHPFLLTR